MGSCVGDGAGQTSDVEADPRVTMGRCIDFQMGRARLAARTRHDPKKHDPDPTRDPIYSA
jgi:hypothetical protein